MSFVFCVCVGKIAISWTILEQLHWTRFWWHFVSWGKIEIMKVSLENSHEIVQYKRSKTWFILEYSRNVKRLKCLKESWRQKIDTSRIFSSSWNSFLSLSRNVHENGLLVLMSCYFSSKRDIWRSWREFLDFF